MKLSNCFERIRCVAPAMMLLSLAAGVCTAEKITALRPLLTAVCQATPDVDGRKLGQDGHRDV